jgi:GNAT superfamily N-acetyltransferase
VFALPRSRTWWLAQWLGVARGAPVAHDVAIEADTIDAWLDVIFRIGGAVETGSVEAWPILRRAIPACRIAVVQRPIAEVVASLAAIGLDPPIGDLERRAAALDALAGQNDVLALRFADLADPRACAALQEHCLCRPFNWPLWVVADRQNLQIDVPARMARLAERRDALERLKAEMAERLAAPRPFVTVGEERWADVADDVEVMGSAHHAEATEGEEGPYLLARAELTQMEAAGLWRVFVARVDGTMAGYCCWSRQWNGESDMPPTMMHGPYYVAQAYARHRLGVRLLRASRDAFARDGVKAMRLHHTMHGRGARAGALYRALGAVETQREYLWRIGAQ